MAGSLSVRKKNAEAAKKRRAEQMRVERRRANQAATSNVGALGSGIASIPKRVVNYIKTSTPSSVARDVKGIATATYDAATEDPNAFIEDAVFSPLAAIRDFGDVRETARKLRAQGRNAEAEKMEAMAGTAILSAVPILGRPAGVATRKAVKGATKTATKTAKKTATKKAVVPEAKASKATQRGIVNTPDLRTMNQQQAIQTAKTEPHIIPDKSGQYVGAPRGMTSPLAVKEMRENFDKDVAMGAEGGDWYTRARATNEEWAGPDPARQRLLAREQALWSAQATPDTNMNFALQGHNAYEMGSPLETVRTGQQARTYRKARDAGVDIPLGKKTGIYGEHLDPTVPHATTGTNDIWHARGFGYTDSDGSLFSRALTPQEHRFLDYETMLAVDRANTSGLAGRSDWGAHEIQAAPWVAGKGRALAERKFKKGKFFEPESGPNGGPGLDDEVARELTPDELAWGIGEASKTYPDYAGKYTAYGTSERVPYVKSGHLSGIVEGDDALRAAYSSDPRASWSPEGRDILIDALGGYQQAPINATGFYTPPGGSLEINPATVTRPLVGITEGSIDPASRGMMDVSEAVRAYIDAQGAGAWNKPIANAKPGQMGSVFVPMENKATGDMLVSLREMGGRYGLPDVVDTGQGVTLTNFYPGPPGGAATGKALRGDLGADIAALTGSSPMRVKVDSGYIPTFEKESTPGSGVVTRGLRDLLENYPELVTQKLDDSQALRQRALSGAALDEEMARQGYGVAREDIQRARRIIGEKGFKGLFDALDKGVVLPGIAALMTTYGLGAEDEDKRY